MLILTMSVGARFVKQMRVRVYKGRIKIVAANGCTTEVDVGRLAVSVLRRSSGNRD